MRAPPPRTAAVARACTWITVARYLQERIVGFGQSVACRSRTRSIPGVRKHRHVNAAEWRERDRTPTRCIRSAVDSIKAAHGIGTGGRVNRRAVGTAQDRVRRTMGQRAGPAAGSDPRGRGSDPRLPEPGDSAAQRQAPAVPPAAGSIDAGSAVRGTSWETAGPMSAPGTCMAVAAATRVASAGMCWSGA